MAEYQVNSIVSSTGEKTAVVGEGESQITYTADNGVTSLAGATGPIVVWDGIISTESDMTFAGGTIIGVNEAGLQDSSGTTAPICLTGGKGQNEISDLTITKSTGPRVVYISNTTQSLEKSEGWILRNLVFDSNDAVNNAGVIEVNLNGGTVYLDNCTFRNNDSGVRAQANSNLIVNGGGFYNQTGSCDAAINYGIGNVIFNDVTISQNTPGSGKLFYRRGGNLTVNNSTISDNTSVYVFYANAACQMSVNNSTIADNTGTVFYSDAANTELEISGSTFSGNNGIVVNVGANAANSVLEISGSTFSGNNGTGIQTQAAGTVYISECVFDQNTSSGSGGGVYFVNNSDLVTAYISDTIFSGNKANAANQYGGAIRGNSHAHIHLSNVTVVDNEQAVAGSAIFTYGGTIHLDGLLTLGSDQSILMEDNGKTGYYSLVQINGEEFFSGKGAAKAIETNRTPDNWSTFNTGWKYGSYRSSEGYMLFVLNGDLYVTNVADVVVAGGTQSTDTPNASILKIDGVTVHADLATAVGAGKSEIVLLDTALADGFTVDSTLELIGANSSFGGTITVNGALTLSGDYELTSVLTVTGNVADLSGVVATVSDAILAAGAGVIASGVSGLTKFAVNDYEFAIDEVFTSNGKNYLITNTDETTLSLVEVGSWDTAYVVNAGTESITINGESVACLPVNGIFNTLENAAAAGASLIIIDGKVNSSGMFDFTGSTITGVNDAVYNAGDTGSVAAVIMQTMSGRNEISNLTFKGNTGSSGAFQALAPLWEDAIMDDLMISDEDSLVFNNVTFDSNITVNGGGVLLINTIGGTHYLNDVEFRNNNAGLYVANDTNVIMTGGGFYENNNSYVNDSGKTVYGDASANLGKGNVTFKDVEFIGNRGELMRRKGGSLTVEECVFQSNARVIFAEGTNAIAITGSEFVSNSSDIVYTHPTTFNGSVNISESTFTGNKGTIANILASGGEFTFDKLSVSDHNNEMFVLGAVGTNVYHFNGTLTISNSEFSGCTSNGIRADNASGSVVTVSNTKFVGISGIGVYSNTYGAIDLRVSNTAFIDGKNHAIRLYSGKLTAENVLFSNSPSRTDGGALHIHARSQESTISGATFATATDTIYNDAKLNFKGSNIINASIIGSGTFVIAADATLTFGNSEAISVATLTFSTAESNVVFNGKVVNFTTGQNMTGVEITVNTDNFDFANSEVVTVATGIKAGTLDDTITLDGVDAEFFEVVAGDGTTVAYKRKDANVSADKYGQFVGDNGVNIMTSGTLDDTLFSAIGDEKSVNTLIAGGKVGDSVIGGMWADALVDGFTAKTVDSVNVVIGKDTEISKDLFAGGFLYGSGKAADAPQLSTTTVTVDLRGGVVNGEVFCGTHVRDYGVAYVGNVEVSVSGGQFAKVYGGGYAQTGGITTVDNVSISVSGGTIGTLFAGGSNAKTKNGYSIASGIVNNAEISVSGGDIDTICLSGEYANSAMPGTATVTLNITGGVIGSVTGSNYGGETEYKTMVNVGCNVTGTALENIDVLTIAEGFNFNGSFSDIGSVVFDLGEDGLDKEWTALTGVALDEAFASTLFTVGEFDSLSLGELIDKGVAELSDDKSVLKIISAQIA